MTAGRQPGSGSSAGVPSGTPATRRRPPSNRDGRALTRAGTAGTSGGINPLLIWTGVAAVICLALLVGLYLVTLRSSALNKPTVFTPADVAVSGTTLGQANAPVTLDLYGDFRCSACFGFTVTSGTEGRLVDTYVRPGKVKIVWHNFLVIDRLDGTTASRDAANAALCAADQGKFWPMHDWLYANQIAETAAAFTQDRLLAIGQAAGLDMGAFKPCVANGTHNKEIAQQVASAPKSITGTPSVFVNGKEVDPGYIPSYSSVSAFIDNALK